MCIGRGCNVSFSGKRGIFLFSIKAIHLYHMLGTHVVESRTLLENQLVAAEMDLTPSTQQKRAFPSSALLSLKVSDVSRDDRIGLETEVFFKRPAQRVTVLPCTPAGPEPEGRPAVPPPLHAGSWEPDVLKRSLKGTHPPHSDTELGEKCLGQTRRAGRPPPQ